MTQPHPYQFDVNGTTLVGNLFAPARGQPRACAVLTGPLTSVKEQAAGAYAAALARRGFLALAFDHRTFGESGGDPRQFENPFAKIEDIKAAASALLANAAISCSTHSLAQVRRSSLPKRLAAAAAASSSTLSMSMSSCADTTR